MRTNTAGCALACAALMVSATASAGRVATQTVTLSGSDATGSMLAARRSADAFQYIGCGVNSPDGISSVRYAQCEAADSQNRKLTCITTDAGMLSTVESIGPYSYIWFTVGAQGRCSRVTTWMSSDQLP